MSKKYSIIISVFNESESLISFWNSLKKELEIFEENQFEVLWINDGSKDNSQQIINKIIDTKEIQNIENIAVEFSKNFGHEAAMLAGIDNATGDALICLDADGQHPTSELKNMINSFEEGNEIVLMYRTEREDNSFIKKSFSFFFYKLINWISSVKFQQNASDFFLISKQVAEILRYNYREQNRFIRGFIQSVGFNKKILTFKAIDRQFGKSHYSFKKLIKLSFTAIFAFSSKPLYLSVFFSLIFVLFSFILGIYSLIKYFSDKNTPPGFSTIILFISIAFSLLFIILAIFALYFDKAIKELINRPLYIIKNIYKNAKN